MNNIDVELYMNQFVNFFDNNPNDLMVLIGNLKKDMFYDLVRDQCEKNLYSGTEVSLTQHQIIEIVVKLKNIDLKNAQMGVIVDKLFQSTKFGTICLN
jgi:hypothetical protein